MNYSLVIDVVRDEPYGIILEGDSSRRVYGINTHSKKWAMQINGFEHKDIIPPLGMVITKSLPMTEDIKIQFSDAFGEIQNDSRRLLRRVKSLMPQTEIVPALAETKYAGEFIFGALRRSRRFGRRSRRHRLNKNIKLGKKIVETKVYPMLAVKQKESFQHLFIKTMVGTFDDNLQSKSSKYKNPKGGLTAAGRAHFNAQNGGKLKPGVKGAADTPEKLRRKGSFLTRFFTNPSGPMVKPNGKPSRLALSAHAWGEPIPKNSSDAAKLAAKGRRMLERYQNQKAKSGDK